MSDRKWKFDSVQPFLITEDVRETAEYYYRVLGFGIDGYNYKDNVATHCSVSRDGALIVFHQADRHPGVRPNRLVADDQFTEGDPIHIVDLHVFIRGVIAYGEEIRAKGARILKEPTESYMANIIVEDCNGYRIQFIELP